jgi:hypothetical protein
MTQYRELFLRAILNAICFPQIQILLDLTTCTLPARSLGEVTNLHAFCAAARFMCGPFIPPSWLIF